jgi:histidine triad (HIT) family protein
MATIFQKIIDGEIPCHKVYEDDHVLAFLDVAPLSKGHVLVIPKETASSLHELSTESGAALGAALVTVADAVVKATGATNYNVLQNNGADAHQAVFHVHFHIIPTYSDDDGLVIDWRPTELADGETLASEIAAALTL